MKLEFIVALIEHRNLGFVFAPYLMYKNGPFYTIHALVKKHGLQTYEYSFSEKEIELVNIIEEYSDEKLAKRFVRNPNVTSFYSKLKPETFQKRVLPFIEKQLSKCALILMDNSIRLFKKEAKYANLYDEDEIKVNKDFVIPEFHFEKRATGTRYSLNIIENGTVFSLQHKNVVIINSNPAILLHQSRLLIFENLSAKKLTPFFTKEFVSIPTTIEEKYYETFILNTIRESKVKASGFKIKEDTSDKRAILSLEPDLSLEPVFMLKFMYGGEKVFQNSQLKVVVKLEKTDDSYLFKKIARDFAWENRVAEILSDFNLLYKNGSWIPNGFPSFDKTFALHKMVNWLNVHEGLLRKNEIKIEQNNIDKKYFTGEQNLNLELKTQKDWFDVYATVSFGEFKVPFVKLKRHVLSGNREYELPDGSIAVLPEEWFTQFSDLMPYSVTEGNALKFQKHHFSILQKNLRGIPHETILKFQDLSLPKNTKTKVPEHLNAELRKYQLIGYNWLCHLNKNGFGGCLADDMGLGKTLQTLALLLKTQKDKPAYEELPKDSQQPGLFDSHLNLDSVQPASLIILPTSLVHNWENEINKFTPSLKVYKHVGVRRKKDEELQKVNTCFDVILTTYGTVRNDEDILSRMNFYYLVLDESQYIKNSTSKTYKAIIKLKAKHRLTLTGTPIENSLADLWAQINFLNKGLLGNLAFFKRNFITPIEKHNDQDKQEKLQILIRPFVLRRTKTEVAKELPPLMEQIRYCPMEDEQFSKYEQEKSVIRNSILENIEKEGIEKSSFVLLQGITRLRQLANHPQLLEKDHVLDSGKYNEIFRSLNNLIAENHKVLIFSSFVQHLELIEKGLKQKKWGYCKLTGSTLNREEVIGQFQEDPQMQVFLISLKAGGVGLNLTKADYVFIIDPWWNPAAENQAISRAHRIGQKKNVFVYRFITEDSIEEKIVQLQQQKSSLADMFINSNNPFKEITKDEILKLLS